MDETDKLLYEHIGECRVLREATERRLQTIENSLKDNNRMTRTTLVTVAMQLLGFSGMLIYKLLQKAGVLP